MNILNYGIESILSLLLLTAIYKAFLQKEKSYTFNRVYLIVSLAFSALIPFLEINMFQQTNNYYLALPAIAIGNSAEITHSQLVTNHFSIEKIITFAYISGCSILLGLFIIRLTSISRQIKNSKIISSNNVTFKLRESKDATATFSFFNTILLQSSLTEKERTAMILHELGHIENKHSYDKVFTEILSAILWFNPFFWYMKKELNAVHEFQADAVSVRTTDKVSYLQILLAMASIKNSNNLINCFNQSFIKRRFKMITNEKRPKGRIFKFTFSVILMLSVGLLFACSDKSEELSSTDENTAKIEKSEENSDAATKDVSADAEKTVPSADNDPVFRVVEEMPEFPGGQEAMFEYMRTNIHYPVKAQKEGIQGTSYITFTIMKDGSVKDASLLRGFHEDCDAEALRVVSNMPNWVPGKEKGKAVNVQFNIPIRFKLSNQEKDS